MEPVEGEAEVRLDGSVQGHKSVVELRGSRRRPFIETARRREEDRNRVRPFPAELEGGHRPSAAYAPRARQLLATILGRASRGTIRFRGLPLG